MSASFYSLYATPLKEQIGINVVTKLFTIAATLNGLVLKFNITWVASQYVFI